jgi:hypothetical protein
MACTEYGLIVTEVEYEVPPVDVSEREELWIDSPFMIW